MQDKEKQNTGVWALFNIYKIISKPLSYSILKTLLDNGEYNTKVLWKVVGSNPNPKLYSFIPQSTFFNHLDELTKANLIDRIVHDDRTVSYKISDFGKFILEDSQDILDKIKEVFGATPTIKETKYGGKNNK